ncbi:VOC family protein [Flavobacterium album]|nr:VOC family protein [Flavobacterium album]
MAKFTALKPMIYTRELKETVAFYVNVLGFECAAFEESWGWASFVKDGVEIMACLPNEHIPFDAPLFTGSLYITTEDADALWQQWKDKCRVCYEIETFEYGMREFAIYDNNGYLLQFGQEINQ